MIVSAFYMIVYTHTYIHTNIHIYDIHISNQITIFVFEKK